MNCLAMVIAPHGQPGQYRSGSIDSGYTVREITRVLGFGPNVQDDPGKVKYSWGFTADGTPCGIWDYRGGRWSVFGPPEVFAALFPPKQKEDDE
jgi:hypothetical protein